MRLGVAAHDEPGGVLAIEAHRRRITLPVLVGVGGLGGGWLRFNQAVANKVASALRPIRVKRHESPAALHAALE